MSRAAVDLQNGDKVLDVSLRYGYDSPTAFNRAFRSVHDMSPSEAKRTRVRSKHTRPLGLK